MKRKKEGQCAICGTHAELSKDHIPPRCLFPEPRPLSLITVPACHACNHGSKRDDESFKIAVATYVGTDTFSAGRLWDSAKRSIHKNQKVKSALLGSVEPLASPTGLFTGLSSILVDKAPVYRVGRKIVAGLFFHHFGQPVPRGHEVSVQLAADFPESAIDHLREWVQGVAPSLERHSIGNKGEFAYGFGSATDSAFSTVWILAFYNRMSMVGRTLPRNTSDVVEDESANAQPAPE